MKDVEISAEFKSQATKAIGAIVLFVITYLLFLSASIGITALCVYIAYIIIEGAPGYITIFLGLGLGSFGLLIFSFLIKFLFKSHKIDRSHLKEIKKADQPELFQLIEEVVNEVESDFPKKVYFSTEVNASVFYNSSFWSMFIPVRKNLVIGLGLINTITKEELKAILSHEFGHFSQKSMKVGSYVYYVNQTIFNLLYDNESYDEAVSKWAEASSFFAIFVIIAVNVVKGIQWILAKMYGVVNKSYLALSREMEFHADEIAASVTGYQPMADSLLRMQLADYSLNSAFGFYGDRIAENKRSKNIFREQSLVMDINAASSELKYQNDLPHVTFDDINKFNNSKLVIQDQWASHPSTEERIEHLKNKEKFVSGEKSELANSIIKDLEKVQEDFTNLAFSQVKYNGDIQLVDFADFKEEFSKNYKKNTFSKVYNGYYDDKNPIIFDLENASSSSTDRSFEELFSNELIDTIYDSVALTNDVESITMIKDKTIPVKSFDYDGKKYKRKEAEDLIKSLQSELDQKTEAIKMNDIQIYQFFLHKENTKNQGSKLKSLYQELFDFDKTSDQKMEIYTSLGQELEFINQRNEYDTIRLKFKAVSVLERKFKKSLNELLKDEKYQEEITPQIKENMDKYLKEDLPYFGQTMYFENNLNVLFTAMQDYVFLLMRGYFLTKKELLQYQKSLL